MKQPNSICKNSSCRKAFYACAFCTHENTWRAVACCPECFHEYVRQVEAARAIGNEVHMMPERIDMTEEQVQELMEKPIQEVKEITANELADYSEDIESIGLSATIDKINDEIFSGSETIQVASKGSKRKSR